MLDRDGVLNSLVIDPEQGTIDSPLARNQVEVFPWVPEALLRLHAAGYKFAVVTNQPAAAKGKTTLKNLQEAHEQVLEKASSGGLVPILSFICFHRAEDNCQCRKPKVGLLKQAAESFPSITLPDAWIVGDGITDIQAGKTFGIRTAFLAPKKCDHCKIIENRSLEPDYWGSSLLDFSEYLLNKN